MFVSHSVETVMSAFVSEFGLQFASALCVLDVLIILVS